MRYVRQGNPKYAKIQLNDLYRIELWDGAARAASCLVDGRRKLTEIDYIKGTNITKFDVGDINSANEYCKTSLLRVL